MRIVTKVRIGFVITIFLSFMLAYTGFLGIVRVKYAFQYTKKLSNILYHTFFMTYNEDMFLLTRNRRYSDKVMNGVSKLVYELNSLSAQPSLNDRLFYIIALKPSIMEKNVLYYSNLVKELVSRVLSINRKIIPLMSSMESNVWLVYSNDLQKELIKAGFIQEAFKVRYLLKMVLSQLDPKMLTEIEDVLLSVGDQVKSKTLLGKIDLFRRRLRSLKDQLLTFWRDVKSYQNLSGAFYEDVWHDIEGASKYTNKAIFYTMLLTTLLLLILVSVSSLVGYKFSFLLNKYFNQMIVALDDMRKGKFSERVDYSGKDEFGVLAGEFNEIMSMLHENIGAIIDESQKALSARVMNVSIGISDDENPLVMARKVVETLVSLNQYKSVIEDDYDKHEIYSHLYGVLRDKFGIDEVIILELNESKNRLEPVFCQSQDPVPVDVVVNPQLCRAKRTARLVDAKEFTGVCNFSVSENERFSICIPILMAGEVKGIVKLFVPAAERERVLKELPFIVKYVELTAPVVYAAKLIEITREQSLKDSLTGLYNRRFLESFLEKYLSFAERKGFNVGFIMIDIDNFKRINDTYGHRNGDIVLKEVAHVIATNVRSSDVVVRYGGEEFLVVLPDVAEGKTEIVAEKIRKSVEMTAIHLEGKVLHVTVSCGVAEYPKHGTDPYQVIKFADIALYRAKKEGKNRVVVFDESMADSMGDTS